MKTESDIRTALRRWIVDVNGKIAQEDLCDDTPIFRNGILKSVQVSDLILYIEELAEQAVEVDRIMPGVFRDIDTIYQNFFGYDHA